MSKYPDCPETDKLVAVSKDSQKIGVFLDWLQENEIVLARYCERDDLHPLRQTIESLLAEYFEIDLNKVEKEKRAIIKHLQEEV